MKRRRSKGLLEVEAMLSDYERRTSNHDQFRNTAIPGARRTLKAKDAERINGLLDEIFETYGKAGDR